jgi:hypothetical protein
MWIHGVDSRCVSGSRDIKKKKPSGILPSTVVMPTLRSECASFSDPGSYRRQVVSATKDKTQLE